MMKIGETIIEGNLKESDINKTRHTVRAVILNENKVLMLYSTLYNDYIFPGGGIKEFEDHNLALKRELLEELGANRVEVIKPIGYTLEFRYGINGNNSTYKQFSYFYICKASNFTNPTFDKREIKQGLKSVWVEIDEVISHNNKELKNRNPETDKGFITVIERENRLLKYIKENLLNAQI